MYAQVDAFAADKAANTRSLGGPRPALGGDGPRAPVPEVVAGPDEGLDVLHD
jgi:hypothetical protein